MEGVELVDCFCYLGDVIQRDGGCGRAVRERVRKGWGKFRELGGVLCNKRIDLKMRGAVYRACVRTVMMYGAESWPVKKEDEEVLVRAERRMVRMMCGVTLANRERSADLLGRLGLKEAIADGVRKARLRWFGHVARREGEVGIRRVLAYEVKGKVGRGKPRRTWYEVVKRELSLVEGDALDRGKWRKTIRDIPANPR